MIRKGLFLFISSLLIFALIGCASETSNDGENGNQNSPENGSKGASGELKVAYNAQPPTLDPYMTTAVATRDIARHMFEGLVTFNSNFEVEPMLAESYEMINDGKTIIFQLREGVIFHNGNEMLAEDVVASMQRWFEVTGLGKSYFSNATLAADGDYTVILEMEEALGTTLHMLADPNQIAAIMPKEIAEGASPEGVTKYIGTGPFQLQEWRTDQYVHLVKFNDYQPVDRPSDGLSGKKEAKVQDLYFYFVRDSSTRLAGIQTGEYDVANAIPFDNAEMLEHNPDVINYVNHNGFNGLVFNKKARFFTDVKARQAVNAALDQEEILIAAFTNENFYELEHGLMIKDQIEWYSEAGKEKYNQNDPEKAEQLLAEAGYNGEEIIILATRDYDDHYNAAIIIQQQLERIGMNVKLDVYDWATLLQRRTDENAYDIFVTGFPTEPIPTGYVFLDSSNQWPGWTNSPQIDEALDKINKASSQEEAKQYFEELQEEFYEYLPIIKFGNKTTITTTRANVEGFDFLHGIILWNAKN